MNTTLNVYKPVGLTPYDMVKKLKKIRKYKDSIVGYAGRLDPMAEGVLILLIDEENKHRKRYERLNKTYSFEVLFGIQTDSYDVLGIIKKTNLNYDIANNVNKYIHTLVGTHEQSYPPFSSVRVQGKPLFYWARKNKLDGVSIPSKKIHIYNSSVTSQGFISGTTLKKYILEKLEKVQGDFRQETIIRQWQIFFTQHTDIKLLKITCEIECSSGTYIRSIAHELGNTFQVGALALSIKRIAVGDYTLDQSTIL